MPTASPSIRASVGAVELSLTSPVSASIPSRPIATPTIAVTSGSPAASSAPNVTIKTMNAATSPIASPLDCLPLPVLTTPPENSTWRPARRAGPATRSSAALVASVSLSTDTANARSANETRPSRETVALFRNAAGVVTVCGTRRASATVGAISLRYWGSRRVWPAGAATTIRAVAPPVPGNFLARRFNARCDSVPGTLNASLVFPFSAPAPMPNRSKTAIQSASTRRRRRKAQRPSRYRGSAVFHLAVSVREIIARAATRCRRMEDPAMVSPIFV